ncbi:MAG: hypothetical protein A2445_04835 [Candidatus Jacksonbacteria bacterium RIFOXYC2_FULL_44_29]|nr:MAG: hypothetical protein UW45_C0002G0015 [Parcubacteria group bacterium GW2011_GWC2_44_22]OGY75186.1 MAG: hypothetical protein A2240_01120 [Candidatus Jacksonbacteria bacterium RIFOXYA2_FULL_43_12]OGY75648.1 MAG: hypothetical protein A2295_04715 [Candidatus Jacksonbacteria bacterium RIFOXYB2_FULL_44_15]OGY77792.1 MAG: hypothetical protein A2445_04835 [Candidatus Jacksonbacteria bacterium RIFOXYC2_FULL_44_29]OGY79522.1 MAG: hypothetical protein A2550_02125 [Candidatus Jacksonbacteria bacteri
MKVETVNQTELIVKLTAENTRELLQLADDYYFKPGDTVHYYVPEHLANGTSETILKEINKQHPNIGSWRPESRSEDNSTVTIRLRRHPRS